VRHVKKAGPFAVIFFLFKPTTLVRSKIFFSQSHQRPSFSKRTSLPASHQFPFTLHARPFSCDFLLFLQPLIPKRWSFQMCLLPSLTFLFLDQTGFEFFLFRGVFVSWPGHKVIYYGNTYPPLLPDLLGDFFLPAKFELISYRRCYVSFIRGGLSITVLLSQPSLKTRSPSDGNPPPPPFGPS